MKITTELDESDILTIIAQRFNVDEVSVKLSIEQEDREDPVKFKAIIVDETELLR